MSIVPAPYRTAATAGIRLETARAEYLKQREELQDAAKTLDRLSKLEQASQAEAKSAAAGWRDAMRAAKGEPTKEVREFQEKERSLAEQTRYQRDMIEEQAPLVEYHQILTHGARTAYHRAAEELHYATAHEQLTKAAEAVFASGQGKELLGALPTIFERLEKDVYNDVGFMATHGLDVSSFPGKAIRGHLTETSRPAVDKEIHRRQAIAVGEIAMKHLQQIQGEGISAGDAPEKIDPLPCEAPVSEMGNGIRIGRRKAELECILKKQAA
ncbi:TMEM199/VMA12 family vacuolar ATPase assembly factor [Chromohalobacter canadensis]|uniref:TMEM199/VMA12 family vacuolar ATPase assembly factor n=1 Tax=Chromohalobacter canadensis TaxID=141389 RepID=A0ABZ0YAL9_9GAMM|nr:TMEM199/VMA12 family vacuolar ATPase assembly factor [Chromohalobacter canadensis]MCK0767938.1 TMEM199/VMA12 family vacuolar ATPase assembly factor [Chromohalobacter canadensis]WQH08507.1 TMEM199/VMA12 family vacuolar ATPase assembly factor [Chromohalobacter canadensis]